MLYYIYTMKHTKAYMGILMPVLFLAASCEPALNPYIQRIKEIQESYLQRDGDAFTAWNFAANEYYSVEAVHLAENDACVIYGEKSSLVSIETAENIAREFAERIHPRITGTFGAYKDVDNNGKLTILLLDIKDDSNIFSSYMAGYFNPADMFSKRTYPESNARDMLYMDTNPGTPGSASFFVTLAHELQHLINFSITWTNRVSDNQTHPQDTWIDEGLSSAAEYVYGEKPLLSRINHFNNAGGSGSTIHRGNNFFIWTEDEYVLDEYASVYLFFQWLRLQAKDQADPYSIYKDIINSPHSNYQAVLDAVSLRISPELAQWEPLLKTWLLANYVNSPKGLLGYNGEIRTKVTAIGDAGISLGPGEGVYSLLDKDSRDFLLPTDTSGSPHIRYVGVTRDGDMVESVSRIPGGQDRRVLTFNANVDNKVSDGNDGVDKTKYEYGKLTGKGDPPVQSSRTLAETPVPLDGSSRLPRRRGPFPLSPPPENE
jgi:hypothetical protein